MRIRTYELRSGLYLVSFAKDGHVLSAEIFSDKANAESGKRLAKNALIEAGVIGTGITPRIAEIFGDDDLVDIVNEVYADNF